MPRPENATQLAAFESWYANSRQFRKISENLVRPITTLYGWAERFDWEGRANERDRKAQAKAEPKAIERTAKLLEDQAKAGQLLRLKGVKFFAEHDIIDARAASHAVKTGIELERQAMGLPDYVAKILAASESELDTTIADMESRRRASLSDSESAESGTDAG